MLRKCYARPNEWKCAAAHGAIYTESMNANSVDPLVIGKRIRAARERLGWSQTELAQRAGSVASYQSRLEAGQFERPSVERLSAIARALGVTLAELTDAAPPLPPDVLENLARLTGNDRQLLNEVVATLLAFPPDSREDAMSLPSAADQYPASWSVLSKSGPLTKPRGSRSLHAEKSHGPGVASWASASSLSSSSSVITHSPPRCAARRFLACSRWRSRSCSKWFSRYACCRQRFEQ